MPKKTNEELLRVIAGHEKLAIGGDTGELATERAEAIRRYFGESYGDEIEGRSQVVSKDLADAVDWIMPSLMRVFLSSNDFLRFDPVGPEDEEQAEQESDYVNHVITKENNGFIVLHDWFKDALLAKNGYVKYWWDETEECSYETYSGLSEDLLTLLLQELEASGDEVEIAEQSSQAVPGPEGVVEVYDVKIKRTRKKGKVLIEPTPPEEIRVSHRARGSLQETVFVQHITKKTRSELIEMGLGKNFVDELPTWYDRDQEDEARSQVSDEENIDGNESVDRSTDEIEYKETYIRVDHDEDGIAELRRIVVVGNKIPDGSEWNTEADCIPFAYLTPNRMPHRHVGRGLNDELEDIAKIKTALLRASLDNTYLLNNVEWLVNERVNLKDFMTSRPGGVKRIQGKEPIGDSASPVIKAPIIQHVIPVLDYMDALKESRTGVGRNTMGLDPETLRKTTEGAARMALQQANAKIEMVARLFAETGVKDLAMGVHELLIKHQDQVKQAKLKDNWVQVNPQEWKTRTDMTVNVGIGSGSMEEIRSNLLMMAQIQEKAAAAGIVLPRNVYNLAEKISDNLGFKQRGMFFTDPDSPEAQQMKQGEQPNPIVEAEKIKAEAKLQGDQMREQMKHEHEMHKLQFESMKFQMEHALNIAKAEIDALSKMVKADLGRPGVGAETHAPGA